MQRGKHMSRRYFLRLGAWTATAVAVAACTSPGPQTSTGEQSGGEAAPATEAGTFWFHSANETETRRPAVDKFFTENYPNTEVTIEVTPSGYWEKVLAEIASGQTPDMIYMHESRALSFAAQGALIPIDDYLQSQPLIGDAELYPIGTFREFSEYEGKLYGMPVGFAVLMLRYNKTMFDEAGIEVPNDQWTWDDLRTAAAALTKDTDGDGRIDQWGWIGWNTGWLPSWWPLLRSFDGQHFSDDLSEAVLNNAAGVEALDFMRSTWCGDMVSSPTPAAQQQLQSGTVQLFEGGLAAMDYILSQNVTNALNAIGDRFEMGLELYPAGPNGRFVRAGGTSYSIPTGAAHPDLAWELIRYLAGDEEANRLAAQYEVGNPLIRQDYVLKYNAPEGPLQETWRRIVTEGMEQYGTVVQYAPIGEYTDIVVATLDVLAACDMSAQEAADTIVEQANELLAELDA